jgi:hypothetical protein
MADETLPAATSGPFVAPNLFSGRDIRPLSMADENIPVTRRWSTRWTARLHDRQRRFDGARLGRPVSRPGGGGSFLLRGFSSSPHSHSPNPRLRRCLLGDRVGPKDSLFSA